MVEFELFERPYLKVASALRAVALMLVLLCPWLTEVQAQAPIPCPNCRPMLRPTHPESGPWYNPAEPGAGFVFELQNGKLAGFYYGYDANGAPVWWLLNAPLVAAPDNPEVDWVFEVTPLRFDGGGCIDCPYTAPTITPQAQSLRIEFLSRNYARYRVAGGDWKPIYSLAFGTRVYDYFAGVTDFPVPDLTGWWVFVFQLPTDASDPNNPSDRYGLLGGRPSAGVFSLASALGDQTPGDFMYYNLNYHGPPGDDSIPGTMTCRAVRLAGSASCQLNFSFSRPWPSDLTTEFQIRLGDLSDRRFRGEAASGEVLDAYKLGYD